MTDDTPTPATPMHESKTASEENAARRQRQQALAELAQSRGVGADSVPIHSTRGLTGIGLLTPRSPHRRTWRAALAILLVAAVLSTVGYYALRRPTTAAGLTGHPQLVDLAQDGLACLKDVAWSPNGATVAVLGYKQNCPTTSLEVYAYMPGQIDTYSAATGALIARIQPDDAIAQALHLAPPVGATPGTRSADVSHQVIQYERVLWSPNDKQLAIAFSVGGSGATPYFDGVFLTEADGTQIRVLSHVSGPSNPYSGEWNVTTGAYLPIPAGADPSSWQPVPPALRYAWGADGTLTANGPPLSLTSVPPTPALGPIGTPDGGSSFTVWQPASISPFATSANLYLYYMDFAAWSPDGSRLILGINVFDLLTTDPGQLPSAADLASQRIAAAGFLPMRDKGIAQALADVRSSRSGSDTDPIPVLWRPDGRVVAAPFQPKLSPDALAANPAAALPGVRLYDCATGRLLGTLREPVQPTDQGQGPIFARWSPDGSHLLLLDFEYRSLTIWGPRQLPPA